MRLAGAKPSGRLPTAPGIHSPLVETLSGGTWTVADPLLPSDADDQGTFALLVSVSCPAVEPCVAVGNYAQSGGNQHALIERGSVNTWTPSDAPLPSRGQCQSVRCLDGDLVSDRRSRTAHDIDHVRALDVDHVNPSTTPVTTSCVGLHLDHLHSTSSTTTAPTPSTSLPTTTTTTAPAPVTTASSCSAVGSYQDQAGLMQGLIDQPVTPDPASD